MASLALLCIALILGAQIPANFAITPPRNCYDVNDGKTYTRTKVGTHSMTVTEFIDVSNACMCAVKADKAGATAFDHEGTNCKVFQGDKPGEAATTDTDYYYVDTLKENIREIKLTMTGDWTIYSNGISCISWELIDDADEVKEIEFKTTELGKEKIVILKAGTKEFGYAEYARSSNAVCQFTDVSYTLKDADQNVLFSGEYENTYTIREFLGDATIGKLTPIEIGDKHYCFITTDLKMTYEDAIDVNYDNGFKLYGSGYSGIKSVPIKEDQGVWLGIQLDSSHKYRWADKTTHYTKWTSSKWTTAPDGSFECVITHTVGIKNKFTSSDCDTQHSLGVYGINDYDKVPPST